MGKIRIHHTVGFLKPAIYMIKFLKFYPSIKRISPAPILAYHSISGYRSSKSKRHFTIDPLLFNLQMNYLHDNNYRVIDLVEYCEMRQSQATVDHRTIVLTFDDGYADSYINAYPILKKCGFRATFFLICNFVNSKKIFPWLREPLFPRGENLPLSVEQILDMAKEDMDFGSHTCSHQRLAHLSQKQAFEEIQESKIYIEEMLDREIISLSYPYGSFNDFDGSHQEMAKEAGYRLAVTSIYGSNDVNSNPFLLRRIPVYANDDLNTFEMKIDGYYDWIEKVQKLLSLLVSSKKVN